MVNHQKARRVAFYSKICLFLLLFVVVLGGCFGRSGNAESEASLAPIKISKKPSVEFVVLIDNSKSITAKEQFIVRETTKLLIDLVDSGDRVSVLSFDSSSRIVASREINSDQDRIDLQKQIDLGIDFSGNRSDISAGLTLMAEDRDTFFPGKNTNRVALVLSDGRLEPINGKTAEALQEMKDALNGPLADVMTYAVVLGNKYCNYPVVGLPKGMTGVKLMEEDVALSEDFFFHARSLDQLLDTMVFILNRVKGITSMGQEGASSFRIDETVESIMLIVRKKTADGVTIVNSNDIYIAKPDCDLRDGENIYHNRGYTYFDLFIIKKPRAGVWSVRLANGNTPQVLSKIYSPIQLVVQYEPTYFLNEYSVMRAWLQDDREGVTSLEPYRLRMHWSVSSSLDSSPNYFDFHRDAISGQFFLKIPTSLIEKGGITEPSEISFEVVAQRHINCDSLEFDEWFIRRSPPSTITLTNPFIQWIEGPFVLTQIPTKPNKMVFGGRINTGHLLYSSFDVPPQFSVVVEMWDDEAEKFQACELQVIEVPDTGNSELVYRGSLELPRKGQYRYAYTLKGQTKEGTFSIRSPWFGTQVRSLPGLIPAVIILFLVIIHVLGSMTAKVKGSMLVNLGQQKKRQSIAPVRSFDSKNGYDKRLGARHKNDLKLDPIHFCLTPVRILGVFKSIKVTMVVGNAVINGENLNSGQTTKFKIGRPLNLTFPEDNRGLEIKLTVSV